MRMSSFRCLSLAAFVMAATVQAATAQTIKIGVFGPLTGDAAAMGSSAKDAVDFAIKESDARHSGKANDGVCDDSIDSR